MVHPDPELDRYLDGVIAKIAAAQEPDGYLYTPRTASPGKIQPGTGAERWAELAVSHELYNAGHLYEAAAAHFLATGKRSLLDVALKNADLVGPDLRTGAGEAAGLSRPPGDRAGPGQALSPDRTGGLPRPGEILPGPARPGIGA